MLTKISFRKLIAISRPRFWVYVAGPFLIGVAGAGDIQQLEWGIIAVLVLLFVFLTFPANILIYGINDIFDYETDKNNLKKIEYEQLVSPDEQGILWKWVVVFVAPFLFLMLVLSWQASLSLMLFLLVSIFYSAEPIRAKAKPPLDIVFSSIIYMTPALIGFFATGGTAVSWIAASGGLLWAFAMQSYSAIPDIEADSKASVTTLATALDSKGTLIFCLLTYGLAGIVGFVTIGWIGIAIASLYLSIMIMSLKWPHRIFHYYKAFPTINTLAGFVLFWYLVLRFF